MQDFLLLTFNFDKQKKKKKEITVEFYSGINRKMEVKKEEEIALISFCVLRFHYLLMYASPIVHCGILLSWCLKCSFLKLKIQRILSIQILIFL